MPAITHVTVVVPDYDEAIAHYCDDIGMELVEDTHVGEGKRWVVVAPEGGRGAALLLAQAASEPQLERVGDQTGGRVFLFLETEDFAAHHARMDAAGVRFLERPRTESYGTVAQFEDRYGNRWDLIQRAGDTSDGEPLHTGT